MNERDKNLQFLSELTRRRVIRAAAAYIVVAWVVVQVASIIFPEFDAPDWAMRALLIAFVVGFPPAMLLAWTVDFSPQGFVRTPDSGFQRAHGQWPRLIILLVACAMSSGVLWWAWDDYILQSGQRPLRAAIKSQPLIAVNSPRQLVGSPENAWLGDGVANLIRGDLAESQHAIVISQSRWATLASEEADADALSTLARQIGVDYLVGGEYIETPDGIVLTTYIEDLETGTEIHSSRTHRSDATGVIASVPEHSIRIKQALRIPHTENVGAFEADFATENIAAYEAYIAGLAFWNNLDEQASAEAFKAALASAPDFHVARLRLAQTYESIGRPMLAWSTLSEIPPETDISERLNLYIAGAKAYFRAEQDPEKAIEAYSRLVKLYPYEFEARLYLAESYWLNFQDPEGIEEARRLTELHAYDPNSWLELGKHLFRYGDLDDAKPALEKYVSMQPTDPNAYSMLGKIAQLQGDIDESVQLLTLALELDPKFVEAAIALGSSHFLQGDVRKATLIIQNVVDDVAASETVRIDAAFTLASLYRGLGRYSDSFELLHEMMPVIETEISRVSLALSFQAALQSDIGNSERAKALFDEALNNAPSPVSIYLFALGMSELKLGRFDAANNVVNEIVDSAPKSDLLLSDAIDAANYLRGISALLQDDLIAATEFLNEAVEGVGVHYAIYEVGLARLYQAAGDLERAKELAEFAVNYRDSGRWRSSNEIHIARAKVLLADILVQRGAVDEGRAVAQEFLVSWQDADESLPEVAHARSIVAESSGSESQ